MTEREDIDLVRRVLALAEESEGVVRTVLDDAGLLQQDAERAAAPRLELTRVVLSGTKTGQPDGEFRYEREFATGVFVTRAPNLRGKSTVMRCIAWALTGHRPRQGIIRPWIRQVVLEFFLGSSRYRVTIDQPAGDARPSGTIELQDEMAWQQIDQFDSEAAHQRLMNRMFGDAYALEHLQWFQAVPGRAQPAPGQIRWATFARAVSLDQDEYGELVVQENLPGAQNQKVISALLDLPYLIRLNRAELAVEQVTWESARTAAVAARHGGDTDALVKRRTDLEAQLTLLQAELVARPEESTLGLALTALEETQRRLAEVTSDMLKSEHEVDAGQDTLDALRARLNMIQETIGFRRFFNGIDVSHCPRCEQAVEAQAKEREHQTGDCRVCGRPVAEELEERLKELEREREELVAEVERVYAEVNTTERRRDGLQARRDRLQGEWQQRTDAVREASTTAGAALDRRDRLNQELGQVRERLAEIEVSTPEALEQRARVLRAAKQVLRQRQATEGAARLAAFESEVLRLARAFGLLQVEKVTFSSERGLRVVERATEYRFEELAIGARLRVKIAVFLALALMATRDESRHPRLLLVDSPGQTEMNEADLEAIARTLRALEQEDVELQVIVASQEKPLIESTVPEKRQTTEGALF